MGHVGKKGPRLGIKEKVSHTYSAETLSMDPSKSIRRGELSLKGGNERRNVRKRIGGREEKREYGEKRGPKKRL